MMLRPNTSNWLMRLLSIGNQVSLAVPQKSLLIQNRLACRAIFRMIASLKEVSAIHRLIEEDLYQKPTSVNFKIVKLKLVLVSSELDEFFMS